MAISAHRLPEHLLSRGISVFSAHEAAEMLELDGSALYAALSRLRRGGRVFSPARGIYVVIPPHYAAWGVVPAEHFIDELMQRLRRVYYVGLLSAAALHGAAPQAPQAFQVMVDQRLPNRTIGRIRLEYHRGRHVAAAAVEERTVPTGALRLSGPELTAVDLCAYPGSAGGIDHVADVLVELDGLDGMLLAALCAGRPHSVAARLGWILERIGAVSDLEPLRLMATHRVATPTLLDPSGPRRGVIDAVWRVQENAALRMAT